MPAGTLMHGGRCIDRGMKKIFTVLLILAAAISVSANPDYAFDIWVTDTNVVYNVGHRPAGVDEVKRRMQQVAEIGPNQAVHLILTERSSVTLASNVCSMARDCGLTNVHVDIFEDAAPVSFPIRSPGMSITVKHIGKARLEGIETVHPSVRGDGNPVSPP